MSTIKSSNEHITINADGSGNDILFQSNGSQVASISDGGVVTATSYAGSGASLTALPAAQITGTHANFLSTGVDDNATAVKLTVTDSGININGDITFSSASQGICLGVTSNTDANTLDDYEAGTWTPAYAVGSGSLSMTSVDGTYTKVGRQVTLIGHLSVASVSSPSGALTLTGFPFTSGTGNSYYTAFAVQGSGWASGTTDLYGIFTGNTAYIFGFASGDQTNVADKVEASTNMSLCITYFTT